ncbi:uncharacterized protein LOC135146510 [Zophobas morio]|uniref:uncharacterized protein LOC135146510 n=1 Tax=Zophobas morio TaxID=2755281 RepID=UPI0030828575
MAEEKNERVSQGSANMNSCCEALRKQICEIEKQNQSLKQKIRTAKKTITRLRLERSFLFDKLERVESLSTQEEVPFSDVCQDSFKTHSLEKGREVEKNGRLPSHSKKAPNFKARRDPKGPRRPLSAFSWFCQQRFADLANNLSTQEVNNALRTSWKDLDSSEKEKFFQLYEQDKKRFDKEMLDCEEQ